jgi:hypothetical protein
MHLLRGIQILPGFIIAIAHLRPYNRAEAVLIIIIINGHLGAGACQYWRTGACVRPYVRASIWGSHIETPYKKQQLKKEILLAF